MRDWIKTFILFLLMACAFVNAGNAIQASVFNDESLSIISFEQTIQVKPINQENFCVTQNMPESFVSNTNNNNNFSTFYEYNILTNNIEKQIYSDQLYNKIQYRISHNISPNLEYAIYTRAP